MPWIDIACKFISDRDGISEKIEELGLKVDYVGTIISSFSFLYGIYLVINKLFFNFITSGWTSLMVSVWFLSGVLLLSVGILGLYISKIFIEVKHRPIVEKNLWKW